MLRTHSNSCVFCRAETNNYWYLFFPPGLNILVNTELHSRIAHRRVTGQGRIVYIFRRIQENLLMATLHKQSSVISIPSPASLCFHLILLMDCLLPFYQDTMVKYRPVIRQQMINLTSYGNGRLTVIVIYYPFSPFINVLCNYISTGYE